MSTPFDLALDAAIDALEHGRTCILCTPVRAVGSFPTPRMARMAMLEDEKFTGTVGGGAMEAYVIRKAKKMLKTTEPKRIINCDLTGKAVSGPKMICGGKVDVLLERLVPEHEPILRAIVETRTAGRAGVELVVLEPLRRVFVAPERPRGCPTCSSSDAPAHFRMEGAGPDERERFVGAARAALASDRASVLEGGALFANPISPKPTIFLFGAGHCGQALCRVAPTAGFNVHVLDDRAELLEPLLGGPVSGTALSFTGAACDLSGVRDRLCDSVSSFVVIMTRGHRDDLAVLREVLRLPVQPRYVGMIGSRKKINSIMTALRAEGVPEARLRSVVAPIGLPIGGDTPGEIAISVAAQLVQVRSGGAKGGAGCPA